MEPPGADYLDGGGEEVMRYYATGSEFSHDFITFFHSLNPKLKEVPTVDMCDVILVFCYSDPKKALQDRLINTANKPVLLVVLHNTSDIRMDNSDTTEKTLRVDWRVSSDEKRIDYHTNNDAKEKVRNWMMKIGQKVEALNYPDGGGEEVMRYYTTGSEFSHDFITFFHSLNPELKEVPTVDMCDVILVFCYSDPKKALQDRLINTANKPVLLVVLHNTSDIRIDNSDTTEKTLRVDFLVSPDEKLIDCPPNNDAKEKVRNWMMKESRSPTFPNKEEGLRNSHRLRLSTKHKSLNFFSYVIGKTLGSHNEFVRNLHQRRADLKEVSTVEDCDFILAFSPVVLQSESDLQAALQKLNNMSVIKPAVLVMLHHTFDPESSVPDSNRGLTRKDTLAVDCLFYEDEGLLQCYKNKEAFSKVSEWIDAQSWNKRPVYSSGIQQQCDFAIPQTDKKSSGFTFLSLDKLGKSNKSQDRLQLSTKHKSLNFFSYVIGKTLGSHNEFVRNLHQRRADLKEVSAVEDCDVILAFSPVVLQSESDLKAALQKLNNMSVIKPAVLVMLHHTFDPESSVPDSNRGLTRKDTLAVDCLFYEDEGLLQCYKNKEAFSKVSEWIDAQHWNTKSSSLPKH